MSFQNLGLSEALVHGVQRMGYVDPSPIQLRAIPLILSGRDLIASAQTGTGKTAAFGLPLLSLLDSRKRSFTLSNSRAHPRAGDAGGDGLPRLCQIYAY